MKKIIFIMIFCIFGAVGSLIFINKNFSTSHVPQRDFIVIKGRGENLYPYRFTFPKGTKAKYIIDGLEETRQAPKKIYILSKLKWKEVNPNEKIYYDNTIKAEF